MTVLNDCGTLFVIATPIGNLGDLSPRAQAMFRDVSAIYAEDTRHTGQLLMHLGIRCPLVALHDHNEDAMTNQVIFRLKKGESLALVSDAGTPVISDPGFRLIRAVQAAMLRVSPIPGPCAAIAALSVSGLPSDRFIFEGFLPAKPSARVRRLQQVLTETRTLIFYEASHRIVDTMADMVQIFGADRWGVIGRELTKRFETISAGELRQLQANILEDGDQRRGEFVLMIHGATEGHRRQREEGLRVYRVLARHLAPSLAARLAAELTGAARKDLYGAEAFPSKEAVCHTNAGGVGQAVASSIIVDAEESPGSTGQGAR